MEKDYWLNRWQTNQVEFNQEEASPHLQRFWPLTKASPGDRVFVPLCGKSVDMLWLAEHGFDVIGVELSLEAAQQFFAENNLTYETSQKDSFMRLTSGSIAILVGDFFELTEDVVGEIDSVYDRAALIALPQSMRVRYAQTIAQIIGYKPTLLITVSYDQNEMPGPPFSVTAQEVQSLYSRHDIDEVFQESFSEIPPRFKDLGLSQAKEHVFILHAK